MATWSERFDELDKQMRHQMDRWRAEERNHNQVIDVAEDLIHFMRQWDGRHARNEEMPGR